MEKRKDIDMLRFYGGDIHQKNKEGEYVITNNLVNPKNKEDTRNPVLASAFETLGITENRYSGIPTIRMEMEKYNLRQPEFLDERGSFIVKLYKESKNDYEDMSNDEETNNLIVFCKTPRTRKEICDYLGLNSVTYAIQTYVNPLVEAGVIKLSIPDKPKSPKQLYYSVEREE